MEGAGRYKKRDKQDIFFFKNHKCEEGVRFTGRQTENEKKKKNSYFGLTWCQPGLYTLNESHLTNTHLQ